MWYIVGLGNPGEEYENSRHNAGRSAVRAFHQRSAFSEWKEDKKTQSLRALGALGREKVTLMLPETFMNKSGSALKKLITGPKQAERVIVVYDDLDLPLGDIRIAFGRGSGGHKGLESVIRALRTKNFTRIRIGISPHTPAGKLRKPHGGDHVVDHVLGTFKANEAGEVKRAMKEASEALSVIIEEGRAAAMNRFN